MDIWHCISLRVVAEYMLYFFPSPELHILYGEVGWDGF